MRRTAILSTTALLSGLAAPALADVTPADVWQNTQAYMEAFGGQVTGDLVPAGKAQKIENWALTFALPFDAGMISMSISDARLIDNGDGTVTMRYPDGTQMELSADIPGEFAGSMTLAFTSGDVDMVASGEPGNISYTYDIPSYTMEFVGLDADTSMMSEFDAEMFNAIEIAGFVTVTENVGTMQVTEGELVTTAIDGSYGGVTYDVTFEMGDEFSGFQKGETGAAQTQISFAMPAGGASLMALPQALKDGMAIAASYTTGGTSTNQEITTFGEMASYTRYTVDSGSGEFSFDADGLAASGALQGYDIDMLDPEIGLPIKLVMASLGYDFAGPLMGSEEQQGFTYAFDIAGLALDDSLWGLFDPAGALPRDPADLRLRLTGMASTAMDLLDVAAWQEIERMDPIPFGLHAAKIEDLYVKAVGTEVSGTADFTFDMNDLESFDGFPAPSGNASLAVKGANALIDKLIEMGLLTSEDAMGARMGMSMFTTPGEGDDSLTSNVTVDGATGSVEVNGMRIR